MPGWGVHFNGGAGEGQGNEDERDCWACSAGSGDGSVRE